MYVLITTLQQNCGTTVGPDDGTDDGTVEGSDDGLEDTEENGTDDGIDDNLFFYDGTTVGGDVSNTTEVAKLVSEVVGASVGDVVMKVLLVVGRM